MLAGTAGQGTLIICDMRKYETGEGVERKANDDDNDDCKLLLVWYLFC